MLTQSYIHTGLWVLIVQSFYNQKTKKLFHKHDPYFVLTPGISDFVGIQKCSFYIHCHSILPPPLPSSSIIHAALSLWGLHRVRSGDTMDHEPVGMPEKPVFALWMNAQWYKIKMCRQAPTQQGKYLDLSFQCPSVHPPSPTGSLHIQSIILRKSEADVRRLKDRVWY